MHAHQHHGPRRTSTRHDAPRSRAITTTTRTTPHHAHATSPHALSRDPGDARQASRRRRARARRSPSSIASPSSRRACTASPSRRWPSTRSARSTRSSTSSAPRPRSPGWRRRASPRAACRSAAARVDTAHGRLPVPAPATLELLAGADVEAGGDSELTTPTGAAILAASVSSYGVMPALRVVGVGWGAGDRELADRPNLLRVVAGVRADLADASARRDRHGRGQHRRHEPRAVRAADGGAVRRRRARRLVHADRHEEVAPGAHGRGAVPAGARATRSPPPSCASRPPSACASRRWSGPSCRAASSRSTPPGARCRSRWPATGDAANAAPEYEACRAAGRAPPASR